MYPIAFCEIGRPRRATTCARVIPSVTPRTPLPTMMRPDSIGCAVAPARAAETHDATTVTSNASLIKPL